MHRRRFSIVFLLMIFCQLVLAHEGHQPLPTKGVQINVASGQVALSAQARHAIGMATAELSLGEVASQLTVYAETDSPWQSRAFGSAQIAGRIVKLLVRPGDLVEQDQVVAELSSRELEILRLDYSHARKEVELNQELLALSQPSAAAGAVPKQRIMELENALRQSENNLQIARIRAKTLGIETRQLDQSQAREILHEIRSPIAGKVVHSDLSEGKFVEAFEHLFEIVNNDTIWVRLQLLEKDIYKVSTGQPVELNFSDSQIVVNGEIGRIDIAPDPTSQVSWAWMNISHPAIIPGMVGIAKIRTMHQNERLAVPRQSVFSDGLQSYVFVEEASTKTSSEYRKRNVILGKQRRSGASSDAAFIEVLKGDVYPGDRVVTKGGHELSSLFFPGVLKLSESDRQRLGILTATASHRTIANTLDLAAVVALPPEGRSVVSSQLSGTIRSHQLSPGKQIQKGDLLIELLSPEFYTLQLDLLRTVMDANLTRTRASRLEEIRGDFFSRRLLLETTAKAEQFEQRMESLKRQLASLGLSLTEVNSIIVRNEILDYLPIRATMDGHLARWTGTLGEKVAADQALVEIQDLRSLWIEAHVPIQDIQHISPANSNPANSNPASGQAILLSNSEIRFSVSIARIGPVANELTRTQSIWLTPDSVAPNVQLRNRMPLTIALETSAGSDALAVPRSAVLQDGIQKFVFIQKAEGYIERRRVTTGRGDSQWIEITSGIALGEEAIVAGGRELQTAYACLR